VDIKVVQGDIAQVDAPAIVVNLFEGVEAPGGATGAVDKALDGAITQLISYGEIKGKKGETTLIHTFGKIPASRVVVLGLGKSDEFDVEVVRKTMGSACRYLRKLDIRKAATVAHGAGVGGLNSADAGQGLAEGSLLGLYRFKTYLTKNPEENARELDELLVVEMDQNKVSSLEEGIRRGRIIAEAAMIARDMVNEPANVMTPTRMSDAARQVSEEHGLELKVIDRDDMKKMGMGAFLGVAQGSDEPPKLIVLKYEGDPDNPDNNLGLIGKGITFDTGGISIKPAANMEDMKGDMAGGASVIAAMQAIGQLKPKINVTGMVAATENMPGGSAQRPGDVVRSMSGKTVEVINTDAEGRLVLSDALHYAREMGITRLVDIATLTGAIIVALGHACSGAMTNNQELMDKVTKAGMATGERIWQLPMYDEYKEQLKSNVADMKNVGGRPAGSITAAQFLSEFVEDTPWVHLDIAGTFLSSEESGYVVKGGTGVPTRALIDLTLDLATNGQ